MMMKRSRPHRAEAERERSGALEAEVASLKAQLTGPMTTSVTSSVPPGPPGDGMPDEASAAEPTAESSPAVAPLAAPSRRKLRCLSGGMGASLGGLLRCCRRRALLQIINKYCIFQQYL